MCFIIPKQCAPMRLDNMLILCLVFGKSEPNYAYKRYAYIAKHVLSIPSTSSRQKTCNNVVVDSCRPTTFLIMMINSLKIIPRSHQCGEANQY